MSINAEQLFGQMVTAEAQAFGAGWEEVEKFARLEFKTLAQRIKEIGEGLAKGDFDVPTGKLLLADAGQYCHRRHRWRDHTYSTSSGGGH
jgi:hypothetical protein